MSRLDLLLSEFDRTLRVPWRPGLAGAQRVWMVVYDEADERRLRTRLPEFELAAAHAGHPLLWCDLSAVFGGWLRTLSPDHLEGYFAFPEDLLSDDGPLRAFTAFAADRVRVVLSGARPDTVVAVVGVGGLFGLSRVSAVVEAVQEAVPGRLAVFFPGTRAGTVYRLLNARDGWNYLAVPIPA